LCDWPQDAEAPTHFSAFGRLSERGTARDDLFHAEEAFKEQEDWNLFYVALTRAKQLLIVSGVEDRRGTGGLLEKGWYARLQGALDVPAQVAADEAIIAANRELSSPGAQLALVLPENEGGTEDRTAFSLAVFDPPRLPLASLAPAAMGSERSAEEELQPDGRRADAIAEGVALHGLLERLCQQKQWPLTIPAAPVIARWLPCPLPLAETVRMQAVTLLTQAHLRRFFDPGQYLQARSEMEIVVDGALLRLDRVVTFEDAVWILDYKRNLLESERQDYQLQLAGYRNALQAIWPQKTIRTALITVDGRLWE
jgi:ATP-dependent helicase/nuclease subunit A